MIDVWERGIGIHQHLCFGGWNVILLQLNFGTEIYNFAPTGPSSVLNPYYFYANDSYEKILVLVCGNWWSFSSCTGTLLIIHIPL